MRQFYLLIFYFLGIINIHGQTNHAKFDSLIVVVYSNTGDLNMVQELVDKMDMITRDMVNKESKIPAYAVLNGICSQILNDQEQAEGYQKQMQALIGASSTNIRAGAYTDEWARLNQNMNNSNDAIVEAADYLEAHKEIWDYNKFYSVANILSIRGFVEKASAFFNRAMSLPDNGEYRSYYGYTYHLSRIGEFSKANDVIKMIKDRMDEPGLDSLTWSLRKIDYSLARFNYAQMTGDGHGMVLAAEDFVKNMDISNDYCSALVMSNYIMLASAHEVAYNIKLAKDYYMKYDSVVNEFLSCDNGKSLEMGSMYLEAPIFLSKIGRLGEAKLSRGVMVDRIMNHEQKLNQVSASHELNAVVGLHFGYIQDQRYHTYYQKTLASFEEKGDFVGSTGPFAQYAYFCVRDRHLTTAYKVYEDLFRINYDWINDLIFTFGEKVFVSYYNARMAQGYNNYHTFVSLLKHTNDSNFGASCKQAYNNLLLTKSIAFKGSQKKKRLFKQNNDPYIVRMYEKWLKKKTQLVSIYQSMNEKANKIGEPGTNKGDLEKLQGEVDDLENKLAAKSKDFKSYFKVDKPKWEQVRDELKEGEVAIEMVRFNWCDQAMYSDSSLYAAYIVRPESHHPEVIYLKESPAKLEGKYYKYYKNLIENRIKDKKSYNRYWGDLKDALKGVKKVYISPDGIYHTVNLPTLYNEQSDKYLLDEIEIQVLTSTADLLLTSKESDLKDAIFIGRPAYNVKNFKTNTSDNLHEGGTRAALSEFLDDGISDLPGTQEEVLELHHKYEEKRIEAKYYLKEQATEDLLYTIKNPGVLHIATHGFWNQPEFESSASFRYFDAMMNSGLLFSGVVDYYKNEDHGGFVNDGILTAFEAQNLQLDSTVLVVLSACESGLGHYDQGEGVIGLQRAFRAAGAKSIINSLWQVDDRASKDFMIAFYSHYLEKEGRQAAFVAAQKEMKDKYHDPYFWGAFMLVGN